MLADVYTSKGPSTRKATGATAAAKDLGVFASAIAKFKSKVSRFKSLRNIPPELQADYNSIKGKVKAAEDIIAKVTGGIDAVKSWTGLGVLPLIPIAWVVGGTSAVLLAYKLVNEFLIRYDAYQIRSEKPGISYAESLKQSEEASSAGSFLPDFSTSKWLMPVALLGAGYLLFFRK